MSIKTGDMRKRWRSCLCCNKPMYTDARHRVCRLCTARNEQARDRTVRVSRDLLSMVEYSGFEK